MKLIMSRFGKLLIVTCIALSIITTSVYADTFSGTRTLNSDKYVEVYKDSSVSSYGYSSLLSSANEEWGGISSNMKGTWVYNIIPSSTYYDTIYITTTSTAGLLGHTDWYKKILGITVSAGDNDDWLYCKVYIYDNTMDTNNMTDAQRIKTIAHELGHTQKLNHPTTTQTSIMNQGIATTTVSAYDKAEIISKWGN